MSDRDGQSDNNDSDGQSDRNDSDGGTDIVTIMTGKMTGMAKEVDSLGKKVTLLMPTDSWAMMKLVDSWKTMTNADSRKIMTAPMKLPY